VNLVLALVLALEVPFIAQKPNYCGPAALAMLANYYGHKVTQDEIASAIYLPEIRGTLTADLAGYAQHYGLWVRQYRGTRADLHEKLSAGIPMIVLGKLGDHYHYFVVLDYRGDELLVHSDARANLRMREDDFLRWWNRADRWTLLVCPPERIAWRLSADEHNDLGVFFERSGKLAPATGHYQVATELAPRNSYFRMNLGNALLKQKLYAEAAAAFRQAVKLDPDNGDALNNLANAYGELNANLDEAVALCERAIRLQPSHRAYYLDTLAGILLKQGKPEEAIAAYEQALAVTTDRQSTLRAAIEQRLAAARAQAN
jgi:tetratricopeptide (TPR) repeat protein